MAQYQRSELSDEDQDIDIESDVSRTDGNWAPLAFMQFSDIREYVIVQNYTSYYIIMNLSTIPFTSPGGVLIILRRESFVRL